MARRKPASTHGIAVVDKPAGVTSHDVVGMLDPLAGLDVGVDAANVGEVLVAGRLLVLLLAGDALEVDIVVEAVLQMGLGDDSQVHGLQNATIKWAGDATTT